MHKNILNCEQKNKIPLKASLFLFQMDVLNIEVHSSDVASVWLISACDVFLFATFFYNIVSKRKVLEPYG